MPYHELETVDGIDPRRLIEPNEVYVPWAEFGHLVQAVGLKLTAWIDEHGPIDTIVAIKHGATTAAAQLERVIPHGKLTHAKLRRVKTQSSGLSVADAPPPEIEYFPSDDDLTDKVVALVDEVWETGSSGWVASQRILLARPKMLVKVVLHLKRRCVVDKYGMPDIFGREINPLYRCYPWELLERVMLARIKKQQSAAVVA